MCFWLMCLCGWRFLLVGGMRRVRLILCWFWFSFIDFLVIRWWWCLLIGWFILMDSFEIGFSFELLKICLMFRFVCLKIVRLMWWNLMLVLVFDLFGMLMLIVMYLLLIRYLLFCVFWVFVMLIGFGVGWWLNGLVWMVNCLC